MKRGFVPIASCDSREGDDGMGTTCTSRRLQKQAARHRRDGILPRRNRGPRPRHCRREAAAAEKLYGTWVSVEPVDVAAGGAEVKVTSKEDGPVKIVAWSTLPFVGEVRETSGRYEVHGNEIRSEAIHGGTSVTYRFEGENLMARYSDGTTIEFRPIHN